MRFIYSKTFRWAFGIFLFIALLFILDTSGYLNAPKSLVQRVFGTVGGSFKKVFDLTKDTAVTIGTIKNLARENAGLNQQIDELSAENARLQSAKLENQTLRRTLGFAEQASYKMVPAEVLILDPTGFVQIIVIDKGEANGLQLGQAVIVSPGILVGRVTKTYRTTSEITLITDPTMTINAEVSDSGARGLLKGEHGISLILDLVTQNEVIKSGDRLITSGLAGDFPRGLLIGEINAIKSSSSELFQQAFVSPIVDLRNLRFVFVIQ